MAPNRPKPPPPGPGAAARGQTTTPQRPTQRLPLSLARPGARMRLIRANSGTWAHPSLWGPVWGPVCYASRAPRGRFPLPCRAPRPKARWGAAFSCVGPIELAFLAESGYSSGMEQAGLLLAGRDQRPPSNAVPGAGGGTDVNLWSINVLGNVKRGPVLF